MKAEKKAAALTAATKKKQHNKTYQSCVQQSKKILEEKNSLLFDCTSVELSPSGITYFDLTKGRPIASIGNWGTEPRYALLRKEITRQTPSRCTSSLRKFVKQLCACWHESHGCFNTNGGCLVLGGYPCSYFRKCVLPPEGYKYGPANLKELRIAYAKIDPRIKNSQQVNVRTCPDCGATLSYRQKYCGSCKRKRRRKSYRKSREKKRTDKWNNKESKKNDDDQEQEGVEAPQLTKTALQILPSQVYLEAV